MSLRVGRRARAPESATHHRFRGYSVVSFHSSITVSRLRERVRAPSPLFLSLFPAVLACASAAYKSRICGPDVPPFSPSLSRLLSSSPSLPIAISSYEY